MMELILQFRLSRKSLAGNSIAELLDNLLVLTFEHLESCEREGRLAKVFSEVNLSISHFILLPGSVLSLFNCCCRYLKHFSSHFG